MRIPCKTPFATLYEALAIPGYSDVIPVGFNPSAPVGTGAFKLQSFTPGHAEHLRPLRRVLAVPACRTSTRS